SHVYISPHDWAFRPRSALQRERRRQPTVLALSAREFICAYSQNAIFYRKNKRRTSSGLMAAQKRAAFFISDRTGITAEMLGHSLLTQFESVRFEEITLPFVDTLEKAREVVQQINETAVT